MIEPNQHKSKSRLGGEVLILADKGQWLESDSEDPPSRWSERWRRKSVPSDDYELVVAPAEVELEELADWRSEARNTDLLVITRAGAPRLTAFLGDENVFFLHPPRTVEDLRSGIAEVLSYRRELGRVLDSGKEVPDVEESAPVLGWVELTGPSHPVFLRRFRGWVERLRRLGIEQREMQRIIHAVREVGWNAIEWGNRFDPERRLSMSFLALDNKLLFRIQDEGTGHSDWFAQSRRTTDAEQLQLLRAEQGMRPGGLGLSLVESIVDRIEVSDQGNTVIFEKRIDDVSVPRAEEVQ